MAVKTTKSKGLKPPPLVPTKQGKPRNPKLDVVKATPQRMTSTPGQYPYYGWDEAQLPPKKMDVVRGSQDRATSRVVPHPKVTSLPVPPSWSVRPPRNMLEPNISELQDFLRWRGARG